MLKGTVLDGETANTLVRSMSRYVDERAIEIPVLYCTVVQYTWYCNTTSTTRTNQSVANFGNRANGKLESYEVDL